MKLTIKLKLKYFWESNYYSKLLWILHWNDTLEEHYKRYYSSKWLERRIEKIKSEKGRENNEN